ncbi:acylphosphatase [Chitinivorax tropicus]|uniref:Acylphosphatase n=1 Tax=Chitinivorax tropicus TaxID=714531 RepID=A0A840MGS6_9PROT|nr:acylphosphatase [Chitinivorax tropicus]MBB5017600.1 acylphosphatase [Chitinivorax tropicus]
MSEAVRVLITGRVQGVGFRDAALRQACRLGVVGWVRNLVSGQVEAHIQGDNPLVMQMVDWCRQGPPGARVDELVTRPVEIESLSGFSRLPTA